MYNPDFPFALESANPLPPPPPPPAAFTAAAMAVVSPVGSLADLLDLVKGGPPGGPIEVISVVPQEALLTYDALRSVETGHGWKVVNSDRVRVLSFLDRTLGVVESVAAPRLSVNPADNSAIRQMRKFADEVSGLGRRVGGSIRDPARALADNLEELATAAEQHTLTNDAIQLLCTTVTQLRSQLVHLNQPPEPEKPALPFDD